MRVVIDSGLARVPVFEPDLGLTRLETVRASRASVDQRRGRAGRTEPGVCYRLWEEAATGALPAFAQPEILSADLSGLVLDLAEWGVRERTGLAWLDAPPAPAWDEAKALLLSLGAIDRDGAITESGRAIRSLALPPRLARMVLDAAAARAESDAADLALLLSEKGLGGQSTDLAVRLELVPDATARSARRRHEALREAGRRQAREKRAAMPAREEPGVGALVALAFPERIARARGGEGAFLMANGRAASVEPHDPLAREPFLAIAEVTGRAGRSRVLDAAAISLAEIEARHGASILLRDETTFDPSSASLRRRVTRRLGAIVLSEQTLPVAADEENASRLADALLRRGVTRLPWTKAQSRLRNRIGFLRAAGDASWPDLSDETLARDGGWLAPFIVGRTSLADMSADDLEAALVTLVPYEMAARLDREAPSHYLTPAGSEIAIDYESEGGPFLDVRVQELFGLSDHPSVASGRLPLTLRLLSPAHRPIQITRDLPGFWRGSWAAVRADMRGRYPRHPWPDDPAAAPPTRRAKPRGQ